jgi:hypothetical protein
LIGGPATRGEGLRGGPVLPICGILFLLAALGPLAQAHDDREKLEVMESLPEHFSSELVAAFRQSRRTEWVFGVIYLTVGGALLASPAYLKRSVWQIRRSINGTGCVIAVGGLLLSGLGILVCFVNGLMMEGAKKDVGFAGHLGVLAGAVFTMAGSILVAVRLGHEVK